MNAICVTACKKVGERCSGDILCNFKKLDNG